MNHKVSTFLWSRVNIRSHCIVQQPAAAVTAFPATVPARSFPASPAADLTL